MIFLKVNQEMFAILDWFHTQSTDTESQIGIAEQIFNLLFYMMYCSLCYCKVSFSNWGFNIFGGNENIRKKICTHQGCNKRNTNNTLNQQLCVENIHLKVCEENLSEGRSLELQGLLKWLAIFQKCYNLFRCFVHTVVC